MTLMTTVCGANCKASLGLFRPRFGLPVMTPFHGNGEGCVVLQPSCLIWAEQLIQELII